MELNFEKFEQGSRYYPHGKIHVTIGVRGRMYFNGRALDTLGRPDGVSLLFDRERRIIGVQPTPLNHRSTYRLRRTRSEGLVITVVNFMKAHNIPEDDTLAFPEAEMRNGIMILDLNKAISVRKGKSDK
jgi:hypothetical protein